MWACSSEIRVFSEKVPFLGLFMPLAGVFIALVATEFIANFNHPEFKYEVRESVDL
jgi:hypothetical protein